MAVVLALRLVIAVTPTAVRWANTAQGAGAPGPTDIPAYLWRRLNDPDESDEDLSVALSDHWATLTSVDTVEGAFELRKAQIRWGRDSAAAAGTDDAVTTHHFLYAPSGTPSDAWTATQFTAVETALNNFWTAIRGYYTAKTSYKQVRWYKAGPDIAPPQAPVRIIDPAVAGSVAGTTPQLPPQVALSCTERTTDPKSWGRFYLPSPANSMVSVNGRVTSGIQSGVADALDTLYEACIAASCFPVVFSPAKGLRPTAGGGQLPARPARALPVKTIQVDDLYDVIRSRRWNEPLLRVQRDIAGS